MKRSFLIVFVMASIFMTGCSQNKQTNAVHTQETKGTDKAIGASGKGATAAKPGDGKVNYLTTEEFKKRIMDYEKHPQDWVFEGDRPVIIDFYATWCRPCRMTAPVVEKLAKEYQGKIDFYKVDVDKEQDLAAAFGIQSIPTFLFIPAKGKPTAQMGAMQKADFEEIIKSVIFK